MHTGTALVRLGSNDNFHFENDNHYRFHGNGRYEGAAHRLKREQLQESKFIGRAVSSLWAAMGKREDETATREEYIAIHICISACVAPDMTRSERREAAEEEWANDAGGKSSMCFEQFTHAMHELADLWTEDVSEVEYKYFLDKLHARITIRKDPHATEGSFGTTRKDPRPAEASVGTTQRVIHIAEGRYGGKADPSDEVVAKSAGPGSPGSRTSLLVRRGASMPKGLAHAASAAMDKRDALRAPQARAAAMNFTLRPEEDVVCIGKRPLAVRRTSPHKDCTVSAPTDESPAASRVAAAPLLRFTMVGHGKHRRWTRLLITREAITDTPPTEFRTELPAEAATLLRRPKSASVVAGGHMAKAGELVSEMGHTTMAGPTEDDGISTGLQPVVSDGSRRAPGRRGGFVGRLSLAVEAARHWRPGPETYAAPSADPPDAHTTNWWQPSVIVSRAASFGSQRTSQRTSTRSSTRTSGHAAGSHGATPRELSRAGSSGAADDNA